jgi:hypothetical protein
MGAVLLLSAAASSASAAVCGTTTWTLWAGQTINVGTLTVENDTTNIYVTYTLTYPNASFGTLHLWVGNDLDNVPQNNQGIPVPGQFPYKTPTPDGTTTYTFVVPLKDLKIQDITKACPLKLYVVAHAEVIIDEGNPEPRNETAFGGDHEGPGPRWWFYAEYNLCCTITPPPVIRVCQTAFAKGNYVFATDPRANPNHLPSLNLTKQRWGWALKLYAPTTKVLDLWAGAGLNSTSRGTKVGTVTVSWNGAFVTVTYNMLPGFVLKEVHIYAGDPPPTTVAPGQYGYTAYFDPPVGTHTESFALADLDGEPGVWLIAHAVECRTGS